MAGSRKKVVVRTLQQETIPGYLPVSGILSPATQTNATPQLDLLDTSGRSTPLPLIGILHIAYVRDFNLSDLEDPERLTRRTFLARPRTEGLCVRATLADGSTLEGLAALQLTLLEDAFTDQGLYLLPPDVRSNTQRLYIPRSSLLTLQVLAVITNPSKSTPPPAKDDGPLLPFPDPH